MVGGRPVKLVVDNRLLDLIAKDIERSLSPYDGFDMSTRATAAEIVRSYKTIDTPQRTVDV